MAYDTDPFTGALPKEVPLPRAPLVRVLTQIRFPEVLAVEQKEFVAAFQEEIRSIYPVLRQGQTTGFIVGPGGFAPAKAEIVWRFADIKGEWRLSLTTTFLTLETTKYQSRKDFLTRLRVVIGALEKHVQPRVVDRIGVRYVDRLVGDAMDKLPELIRPQVLGILGTSLRNSLAHSLQESLFELENGSLLARWGMLPPNQTLDAAIMEAVDQPSWLLDLDMFSTAEAPFDSKHICLSVEKYAERIHALFRWATTEAFLEYYGGK